MTRDRWGVLGVVLALFLCLTLALPILDADTPRRRVMGLFYLSLPLTLLLAYLFAAVGRLRGLGVCADAGGLAACLQAWGFPLGHRHAREHGQLPQQQRPSPSPAAPAAVLGTLPELHPGGLLELVGGDDGQRVLSGGGLSGGVEQEEFVTAQRVAQPVVRGPDHAGDPELAGGAADAEPGLRVDGAEHPLLQGQGRQQQLRRMEGRTQRLKFWTYSA